MEREIFINAELTGQAQNAYSSGRGNIMPDGISPDLGLVSVDPQQLAAESFVAPDLSAVKPAEAVDVAQPQVVAGVNAEDLRNAWRSKFSADELRDYGTSSTIEMMVEMGIGPDEVTSKGENVQRAEDVIKTSLIASDEDRIAKATSVLGVEDLTEEQKRAILEAHYSGEGSVYQLSKKELLAKAKILEEAGFSKEQRRLLMEAGVAGMGAAPAADETPAPPGRGVEDFRRAGYRKDEDGGYSHVIEIHEKFTNAEIIGLLGVDAVERGIEPDFNNPAVVAAEAYIEGLSGESLIEFAKFLVNDRRGRLIDVKYRKLFYEHAVEQIIGLPEKGSHSSQYRLDYTSDTILTALEKFSGAGDFGSEFQKYIGDLKSVRMLAHELRRSMSQGDNYKEFISKGIGAHGVDVMRNQLAGSREVIALLETFSSLKLAETRKWFTQQDIQDIKKSARDIMTQLVEAKQIKYMGRPVTKWEMERAISIGETLFAGTQRFAVYATAGAIPPAAADRIGSLPGEYIARTIAKFKLSASRFFTQEGPRVFQERILERLMESGEMLSNKNSLFGIEERPWVLNGLGSVDVESHGWRAQLMFFGDMKVNIGGKDMTVLDYFSQQAIAHGGEFDEVLGWEAAHHGHETPEQRAEKKAFADSVEDAILGQRLYLSALQKQGLWGQMDGDHKDEHGHMHEGSSTRMKKLLWQKMAMFDPLGISALNPQILQGLNTEEANMWKGLQERLGKASVMRLKLEAGAYKEGEDPELDRLLAGMSAEEAERIRSSKGYFDEAEQGPGKSPKRIVKSEAYLRLEKERFLQAVNGTNDAYKYQILDRYFGEAYGNPLTAEERAVIKKVIDAGMDGASYLSKVKLPYSYLINDAPHVAWDKTGDGNAGSGDENMHRILGNDQAHQSEAWDSLAGLIENPTHGIIEKLSKFVESGGMVWGRETAQNRVEPFVKAIIDINRERPGTFYTGIFRNTFRNIPILKNRPFAKRGNSIAEGFWSTSGLTWDERDRADFLDNLAKAEVISSNITEGMSQLARLKKENKADGKAQNSRFFKLLMLILPAEIVVQLFKSVVPTDANDLGI